MERLTALRSLLARYRQVGAASNEAALAAARDAARTAGDAEAVAGPPQLKRGHRLRPGLPVRAARLVKRHAAD